MTDGAAPASPRILAVPREEWTDAEREVFAFWGEPDAWENGSKTNMMMAMANHPKLAMPFNQWGKHLLMTNTLDTRTLEIIILRVAAKVKSIYEWHNHVGYGMKAGLTLDDIAAIRDFPGAPGNWTEQERGILTATDELIDDNVLSDATWALLAKTLDRRQMMDLVFTIGHYVMTSWALSSFGIEVEGGADEIGFDLKTKSGRTPGATDKPGETKDWTLTRGY